jgi:hypothetical protein
LFCPLCVSASLVLHQARVEPRYRPAFTIGIILHYRSERCRRSTSSSAFRNSWARPLATQADRSFGRPRPPARSLLPPEVLRKLVAVLFLCGPRRTLARRLQ